LYADYVLEGATFHSTDRDGVAGTFSGALGELGAGGAAPLMRMTNGRFSARYNDRWAR